MNVIVLNGASGVGKTTVLRRILARLPGRGAILDGDDVSRVHPFECSTDWLNLVQDNLLCCAENLMRFGVSYLVIGFVLPSRERVDRLNRVFRDKGLSLRWVGLVASDSCLQNRLKERGVVAEGIFSTAREFNDAIKSFTDHLQVDTSGLSPEAVAERVLSLALR
ncbi:MAG: AAA family ATPase [Phycisphaeraceae bacterium]|nr:AAA family ATPase [Phycisphaeraceae bacterium]